MARKRKAVKHDWDVEEAVNEEICYREQTRRARCQYAAASKNKRRLQSEIESLVQQLEDFQEAKLKQFEDRAAAMHISETDFQAREARLKVKETDLQARAVQLEVREAELKAALQVEEMEVLPAEEVGLGSLEDDGWGP